MDSRLRGSAVAIALVVAGLVAACSSSSQPIGSEPTAGASSAPQKGGEIGGNWVADSIAGSPVPGGVEATLRFEKGGKVGGNNGCNGWFATYESTDAGGLNFSGTGQTMMACTDPDQSTTEANFSTAIEKTRSYAATSTSLTLYDSAGDAVMELRPA